MAHLFYCSLQIILSVSHGTKSMLSCTYTLPRRSADVQTEDQNKPFWFKSLKVNMTWLLVLAFEKLLIYWDFHTELSLGLKENSSKKRKYPVSSSALGEKAFLRSENSQSGLSRQKINRNTNNHLEIQKLNHLWTPNILVLEVDLLQELKITL